MKTGKFLRKLVFFSAACLFLSCSEDYLNSPVRNSEDSGAALISSKIDVPKNVTATHGKKGIISIKWTSVKGAVRYLIYSAESPFAEYTQTGESKDPYYDCKLEAGSNRYFKIVAVNYVHTRSKESKAVFGSTLAIPVITSITPSSNGLGATVKWWMSNCSEATYENVLGYDILAYSEDLKTVVSSTKADKGDTEAFLEGLSPKTNYKFEVQAYIQSAQNDVEKSDIVDEETARRLVPAAPENLTVSKGEFTDKITLSWILPDYVDVSLGNKTYESHGLYFCVFRKEKGENDSAYKLLTKIIPPNYNPGDSASYSDTNIEPDVQYVYKVQSYTADVAKEISSDTSLAVEEGWIISEAMLHVEGEYKKEDTLYTAIDFIFKATFEDFGIDYTYFVKEQREPLTGTVNFEPVYYRFENLNSINEYVRQFENISDSEGYYTYALIICPAETESFGGTSLKQVNAPGKFVVTEDSGRLPVITGFAVQDKYKDKFIVSWDYNPDYAYILHWIDGDSVEDSISFVQNDSRLIFEGGKAKYNHEAVSGETRIYTLEASNGLSTLTEDDTCYETLGTAKPDFDEPDYETISFTWKKVQAADDALYAVHAYYSGDEGKTELLSSYEIVAEGTDKYKCVIEKPEGWNDFEKAGKEVTVEIVSKNETNDETVSSNTACLLGPALLQTKIATQTEKDISVSWNKNSSAAGYIIYRKAYSDGKGTVERDTDEIYVSADGKTITAEDEAVNTTGCTRAVVSVSENVITFKDSYSEPTSDTSKYQSNQSKLIWGAPYGYFVVPVKKAADRPAYANAVYAKGSTFGYGLNVKATKAEYANKVKVTWEQPYNAKTKSASLYRRRAGSAESNWEYCFAIGKSDSVNLEAEDVITGVDVKLNAYEYAVLYNGTHASGKVFAPSYESDLASDAKKDIESVLEQANKGYTLAIADISALKGSDYDETVNWTSWNYSERNSGPSYYEIQIKNLNEGNDWVTFAKITPNVKISDGALNVIDEGKTAVATDNAGNGIEKLTPDICSVTITPSFTDGVSDGMLKVLRDARHFYRIVAYKTLSSGSVAEASAGDDAVSVYRDITKEELARCVNLLISDALYKSGIPYKTVSGSSKKTADGKTGTFTIIGSPVNAGNYQNKVKWYFTNYNAKFVHGYSSDSSAEASSFLTLNSGESSSSDVGINGNAFNTSNCQLYYLPALDITVTSSVPLASYAGTVNVTIGQTGVSTVWKMTVKVDGSEVLTASNETDFYKWFPYQLGSTITSSTDVNAEFKIYQSPWWK